MVEKIIDGNMKERPTRLELLRHLAGDKKLPEAALQTVLSPMLEALEDIAIDAPGAER